MAVSKKNLTVRLNDEAREKLELIAERELRPLANQIAAFTIQSIDRYMVDNCLVFTRRRSNGEISIESCDNYPNYIGLVPGSTITLPDNDF